MPDYPRGQRAGSAFVEAPQLAGRHVRLRTIEARDYDFLYHLHTHGEIGFRWRYRGATPSPEEFQRTLWDMVLVQFVVERKGDRLPTALVSAYGANLRDGYVYLAMVSTPDQINRGWTLEGVAVFVDYLFRLWQFRKIYAESLEFNFASFSSGLDRYFEREGVLREHEYYAGTYWDLHLLTLTRSRWDEVRARMYDTVLAREEQPRDIGVRPDGVSRG